MGPKKNTTFLFVNKDSSSESLTRSRAYEKTRILSHVQINRRRLDKTKIREKHWTVSDSFFSSSSDDHTESGSSSPSSDSQLVTQNHRLPRVYPTSNGSDPFFCTAVGDSYGENYQSLHAMLQYGISRVAKTVFLANAFAPASRIQQRPSMRHEKVIVERLRRCVSDKMLMDSSLAYCAGSLTWLADWLNLRPELYLERALPAVRARISSLDKPADVWLLVSIYSLAITELWNGSPNLPMRRDKPLGVTDSARLAACRMHLTALIGLMSERTNLVNPYLLESVILADKYLSITELTPPMLDMRWDPGAVPPKGPGDHMALDQEHASLGGAFFQAPIRNNKLMSIINDTISYIQIAQRAWAKPLVTAEKETWLFLRLHALHYRLLGLSRLNGIEECIRLAILLFFCSANEYSGAHAAAATLTVHLKHALLQDALWKQYLHTDNAPMLLWIFTTGAMSPNDRPERQWFREKLATVAQAAGVEIDAVSFRDFLQGYFFIFERQKVPYDEVVCSVVSGIEEEQAQQLFTSSTEDFVWT